MFLALRGVRKVYQTGSETVTALDGLDLQIEAGQFVALMGPSGCGKTTLLNVIGGMDRASSGEIEVAGRHVESLGDREITLWRRSKVGIIFQAFNLLPTMTVAENVEFPLLLDSVPPAVRRQKVEAVLARVGLSHRLKHRPFQLSGGEMQRVAVARALVHEPELLLADEPTGNLDSASGAAVLALMREVSEKTGQTILMATHSQEAAAHTTRIVHLRDGRITSDEPNA